MLSLEMLGLDGGINVFNISHTPDKEKSDKGEELLEIFNPETDVAPENVHKIEDCISGHKLLDTIGTGAVERFAMATTLSCILIENREKTKRELRSRFMNFGESWQNILQALPEKKPTPNGVVLYYFWLERLYKDDFDRMVGHQAAAKHCKEWFDDISKKSITYTGRFENLICTYLPLATLIAGESLLDPNSEFTANIHETLAQAIETGTLKVQENWISGVESMLLVLFAQKILFPDDYEKNNLPAIYRRYNIDTFLNIFRNPKSTIDILDTELYFWHSVLCGSIKLERGEEKSLELPDQTKIPIVRRF